MKINKISKRLIPAIFIPIFIVSLLISFMTFFELFAEDSQTLRIDISVVIILIISLISFYILTFVYLLIYANKYVFYENGDNLIIERGILFKRKIYIPFVNIESVKLQQTIFAQIFRFAKINFSDGSLDYSRRPMGIYVAKKNAKMLVDFFDKRKNGEFIEFPNFDNQISSIENDDSFQKLSKSDLIKASISNSSSAITLLFLLFNLLLIMFPIFFFLDSDNEHIFDLFLALLIAFLSSIIIFFLAAFIYILIYLKFKVRNENKQIEISYGLFVKTLIKVDHKNINAFYLIQPFLFKIFKRYSLAISVVGLDSEANRTSDLHTPKILNFAKIDQIGRFLKSFNAEALLEDKFDIPKKFSKLNFIVLPTFGILLIHLLLGVCYWLIFPTAIIPIAILLSLSVLLWVLLFIINLSNKGINIGDNFITTKSGFLTMRKSYTRYENIQSVYFCRNPYYDILGIGKILVINKGIKNDSLIPGFEYKYYEKIVQKLKNK